MKKTMRTRVDDLERAASVGHGCHIVLVFGDGATVDGHDLSLDQYAAWLIEPGAEMWNEAQIGGISVHDI